MQPAASGRLVVVGLPVETILPIETVDDLVL